MLLPPPLPHITANRVPSDFPRHPWSPPPRVVHDTIVFIVCYLFWGSLGFIVKQMETMKNNTNSLLSFYKECQNLKNRRRRNNESMSYSRCVRGGRGEDFNAFLMQGSPPLPPHHRQQDSFTFFLVIPAPLPPIPASIYIYIYIYICI